MGNDQPSDLVVIAVENNITVKIDLDDAVNTFYK